MQILIVHQGHARCLYSEAIPLPNLGRITIRRGSHVEPVTTAIGGLLWIADLAPVAGPRLGPFEHRSQALQAEVNWLEKHWLEKDCLSDQSGGSS